MSDSGKGQTGNILERSSGEGEFYPAELIYPPDVLEFMALSPSQRVDHSAKLWEMYLTYGGSFDDDFDSQSPFFDPQAQYSSPVNGRSGVRLIRRA